MEKIDGFIFPVTGRFSVYTGMMKEDFLSYIWKFQLIRNGLTTQEGETVEVIKAGLQNPDSGPDFMHAMIRIGNTLWAGSVEIHVKASDWFRHGHQDDPAYLGVILHVVYEADKPVMRAGGELLPTLLLKEQFDPGLFAKYEDFLSSRKWIPCADQLHQIPLTLQKTYLSALAIERIESRSGLIDKLLESNHGDFEETVHQVFARGFGLVINTEPFEQLARILPFGLCRRYKDQALALEALALGQAGFLRPGFQDPYPARLWTEYQYLMNKHQLKPMDTDQWKFLRIRPTGFPTVRLLHWVALLRGRHSLVTEILQERELQTVMNLLHNTIDPYWDTHFIPDRPALRGGSNPGEGFIRVWIINALVPMLIFYGRHKDRQDRVDMALSIMESFPPEQNKILAAWEEHGLKAVNALEGQGLIYLKKGYCDEKRCLSCSFGNYLLRNVNI